jgi:spoIIIJ-associated protein
MPIYEGTTVEEAIRRGLSDLGLSSDKVTMTTLEEGKKGFLGMGKKAARVQIEPVTIPTEQIILKESLIEEEVSERIQPEKDKLEANEPKQEQQATSDEEILTQLAMYLTAITKVLSAPALVKFTRDKDQVVVHLQTDKQGMLIGKHGKILNALQYLAQVFVHRLSKNKLSIVLNVGDYREKRQVILERLAQKTADKVKQTGRPVFLEPMPAFERKQIHAALSKNPSIQTHSEGDEPYRYLVVEPVRK